MSQDLKLGFLPLTDAAPLIVARARGFFAEAGVDVELAREASWATVRDRLAVGALDGAHLLAPMALAANLGPRPLVCPLVLNRGGAAVTLSTRIADPHDPSAGLRWLVRRRREQGSSPITLAVVFPHSIHNHLLRRWLTDAGVDPERDVRITVAPPPRMAELLADAVIEGFCAGEPWNAAAVAWGAGRVAVRASELWPRAPDKVLALKAGLPADVTAGIVRAVRRAAAWCADPSHRAELIALLADPEHLGLPPEVLAAGLADVLPRADEALAPTEADAAWLVAQMSRWAQLEDGPSAAAAASRTFRRDLFEAVPLSN